MMIAARNAFSMSGAGPTPPPLPYDAEVEYLESTTGGGEYIDTDFRFSTDFSVPSGVYFEAKYQTFARGAIVMFMVGRNASANWVIKLGDYTNSKPEVSLGVNMRSAYGSIGSPNARAMTVRADMTGVTVDGTHYPFSFPSPLYIPTNPLLLFAQSPASGAPTSFYRGRIYSFSAHGASGDIDLTPVRVGSGANAVGYLYDRANPTGGPLGNGLYPNAGTGAFVIGPDK